MRGLKITYTVLIFSWRTLFLSWAFCISSSFSITLCSNKIVWYLSVILKACRASSDDIFKKLIAILALFDGVLCKCVLIAQWLAYAYLRLNRCKPSSPPFFLTLSKTCSLQLISGAIMNVKLTLVIPCLWVYP